MSRSSLLFGTLWLFIIFVSVHDAFLVLAFRRIISQTEQNPIGRLLIQWNQGDIWLLVLLKAVGTLLAAMLMLLLRSTHPRLALAVCVPVAIAQLLLLCWLYQP